MLKVKQEKLINYEAQISFGKNLITNLIIEAKDKNEAAEKAALAFKQSLKINISKLYG